MDKRFPSCSQLWLLHQWCETLDEVFLAELLAFPLLHHTTNVLGWDDNIADNVNNAVLGNAICDRNAVEAVDLDGDESTISSNIDAQRATLKEGWEINLKMC